MKVLLKKSDKGKNSGVEFHSCGTLMGIGCEFGCSLLGLTGFLQYYYTTKLLGGLIQKIHQSDRAIAGLIFSKYQTGSVRIRPEIELFKMADAEEIEVCKLSPRNTKQGPHFELGLDMWNNLGRPEEAAEHENSEVITNSSWALHDFIEEHKSNLTRWGKLFRSHLAWSALVQRWIRQKNRNYSVNYSCTRNLTNTISLILAIFTRWILVAFAVLVFSDTKSRVINLLLTEFARAVLGEYRPSVFLVRTSPKRLGPYCQDLGPIFSQYGPRTRSIRYIYSPTLRWIIEWFWATAS